MSKPFEQRDIESKEYRDQLAGELRETRKRGDREAAKEILDEEQGTPEYREAKTHRVAPRLAEKGVIDLVNLMPGLQMRGATKDEDSGVEDIEKNPAVDAVGFMGARHAFVVQITSGEGKDKEKKMAEQMRKMPFVPTRKLNEGQLPTDPATVPRFNVQIPEERLEGYANDPNLSRHPELMKEILEKLILNADFYLEHYPHASPSERGEWDALKTEFTDQLRRLP